MRIGKNARNAIYLGTLCSISYFAVYIARNILSAVTPQMIESDGFTESYIGDVSSLYFIFYAIGQLINGFIGDKIKAKYMIGFGLLLAGVTTFIFPYVINYEIGATFVYAMTGFFLSMIYAPMTKVVVENTEPLHAVRCSLGYTFASFIGSPAAGLLAALLVWQNVFTVSSAILALMSACVFLFFAIFERQKIVTYDNFKTEKKAVLNIKLLFEHQIVKYSFVSILTGIVRTSVVFWLPTYFAQYLGFSPKIAASIYTGATLIVSLTTFIAVFIYEKLGHNMDKSVLVMFVGAVVFFVLTYFVKYPILNIGLIVLAVMSSNGAASILWSVYCPSLKQTGMVSAATGFLDFLSYMAAAGANMIFANAVSGIGWGNLILVWAALMLVGVIIALPLKKVFKKKEA